MPLTKLIFNKETGKVSHASPIDSETFFNISRVLLWNLHLHLYFKVLTTDLTLNNARCR